MEILCLPEGRGNGPGEAWRLGGVLAHPQN